MINNQKMSFHLWKRGGRREQSSLRPSKGVSLYLSLMTTSILIALALGISAILFSQLKMARTIGYSIMAFYASNTGIERTLYAISQEDAQVGGHFEDYLDLNQNGVQDEEDSSYVADIIAGEDCSALNYCIISRGTYKDTKRAIRVSR